MLHRKKGTKSASAAHRKASKAVVSAIEARYTVALAPALAQQVQKYASANEISMSKTIATLVRIGLESQEQRKRDFFKKLKANLESADPCREDELVDEFRSLILGR